MKSPLRYPGGKQRLLKEIFDRIPPHTEFREPFVGGGSVFLASQTPRIWINDLNFDLVCFWQMVQSQLPQLVAVITGFKKGYTDGKALYKYWLEEDSVQTNFDRAVRFFIMNRITFSGVMDSGGYSQCSFEERFTWSAIERLSQLEISDVLITHGDYSDLLVDPGRNVFIFLDPPYWKATQSKLYGKKGDLHTSFDHDRLANDLRQCPHQWLLTYDDSPRIRELYSFAKIEEFQLQYGMNNYKQASAKKGDELFISNF